MSRDRVEDLGRICVLIDKLLENDLFNTISASPGDFRQWFLSQETDEQTHLLASILESLLEIREITRGEDPLNGACNA